MANKGKSKKKQPSKKQITLADVEATVGRMLQPLMEKMGVQTAPAVGDDHKPKKSPEKPVKKKRVKAKKFGLRVNPNEANPTEIADRLSTLPEKILKVTEDVFIHVALPGSNLKDASAISAASDFALVNYETGKKVDAEGYEIEDEDGEDGDDDLDPAE